MRNRKMSRIEHSTLALAPSILLLAILSPTQSNAQDELGRQSCYPLVKGASWTYHSWIAGRRTEDNVVEVVNLKQNGNQSKAILMDKSIPWAMTSSTLLADDAGVRLLTSQGYDWVLRYPLKQRATWSQRLNSMGNPGQGSLVVSTVDGKGVIESPSGKHLAVAVHRLTRSPGLTISNTTWFARGVGIVKSHTIAFEPRDNSVLLEKTILLADYKIP